MQAPLQKIAVEAAHAAGDLIARAMSRVDTLRIGKKAQNDFVSEVDVAAEQKIIETIRRYYPKHSILAEESGLSGDDEEFVWIIDPLDGTTNFLHGFPQFAVSIAVQHNGELEHAVVYNPINQELFVASSGGGAYLNNRRIRVSDQRELDGALLGTGFPFKIQKHLDCYMDTFKALFPMTAGVRRAGAASLDLAFVAAGRLDGFWEIGLQPWDMAAGALLIIEAGGFVGDFSGEKDYLKTGNLVAGTPKLFPEIVKTIKPHLSEELQS